MTECCGLSYSLFAKGSPRRTSSLSPWENQLTKCQFWPAGKTAIPKNRNQNEVVKC